MSNFRSHWFNLNENMSQTLLYNENGAKEIIKAF